ncbi:MAG: 50S ribosomal protein L22 [Phycisphaerales bacterium JB050]
MKINADKFKKAIKDSGIDVETLAAALPRDNDGPKQQRLALKKVRNWIAGKDHPAAKASEVDALARALGVPPMSFARFTSTFRFARSSQRKSMLVVEMIRGRSFAEADALLQFSPKRAAVMVRKTLNAAVADAEAANADVSRLVVSEAKADGAVIIKRFQPKDRGRAHPIQKRTSHITISVEEAN